MIKHNLQNMLHPSNLAPCHPCAQRYLHEAGDGSWFARAIHDLRRYLAESSRRQACEAENRKAMGHLHALTDEQLRDIGISRMDISRAVRFGKDHIHETGTV
jgi:uncharacterized protein YjiS (DUF1127 family)